MKGIILAGGSGTRLYPITKGVSKQLVAVYDKPLIYYPLSILMLAGIREVLIISTPKDLPNFKVLFGDGSELGMQFEYIEQPNPDGLVHAFILGETFIGKSDVCLVLGDNILYGKGLPELLSQSIKNVKEEQKATILAYHVESPEHYGVVEFGNDRNIVSIEEKPTNPKSNYAILGLYFYPNDVVQKAKKVEPSHRDELEITSLNQDYLNEERLKVEFMGRGYAWFDAGTHESLLGASQFIQILEKRKNLKVACLEEIAFDKGYISKEQLLELAEPLKKNEYGQYLIRRANELA